MRMLAVLSTAILIAGCGDPLTPEGMPYTGAIISANFTSTSSVHVRPSTDTVCGTVFTINSKTKLSRRTSAGTVLEIDKSELKVGMTVNVWADYVLLSCPGQSTAEAIQVVE